MAPSDSLDLDLLILNIAQNWRWHNVGFELPDIGKIMIFSRVALRTDGLVDEGHPSVSLYLHVDKTMRSLTTEKMM